MGSVNVNRSVSDAFYRYKMPRLRAKVEGKGNGIKTVIVNMIDVAKAIGRPATCKCNVLNTLAQMRKDNFQTSLVRCV